VLTGSEPVIGERQLTPASNPRTDPPAPPPCEACKVPFDEERIFEWGQIVTKWTSKSRDEAHHAEIAELRAERDSCGKCDHHKGLHVLGRGGTFWCCHTYCRCPRFVKESALAPKEGTPK